MPTFSIHLLPMFPLILAIVSQTLPDRTAIVFAGDLVELSTLTPIRTQSVTQTPVATQSIQETPTTTERVYGNSLVNILGPLTGIMFAIAVLGIVFIVCEKKVRKKGDRPSRRQPLPNDELGEIFITPDGPSQTDLFIPTPDDDTPPLKF
jgi:hypothetical protein